MPRTVKYEAPASYDELFEMYFGYIQAMLVKAGIVPQRVPDEAMIIITSLIKTDFLASYDGNVKWRIGTIDGKKVTLKQDEPEPEGFVLTGERTAPFMSPFRSYINLVVRAARDRQMRDMQRLVSLSEEDFVQGAWKDSSDQMDEVDRAESLMSIYAEMHAAAEKERVDNPAAIDLSELAQSMQVIIEVNDGKLPRDYMNHLSDEFNVDKKMIQTKLGELRTWLSNHGLQPSVHRAAA